MAASNLGCGLWQLLCGSKQKVENAYELERGSGITIVVIAGPPASGKGTQCDKIKTKFGYVHISTGDILRQHVKDGTVLGKQAKTYMDAGKLVPDDLLISLVKDRLQQADVRSRGCLLDGFPRTGPQAKAMVDAGLNVAMFLLIQVPDDDLVERGCGRRLDPETGDIYHLKFKPPPADIVGRLVHRSDDQEDKIRTRLQAYHSQIDGILPYYKKVVTTVKGAGSPDDVFKEVQRALRSLPSPGPPPGVGRESPIVVIAGPPAAGKGTQCEKIKAKYGFVHISTGDILRENVKEGTELGQKAKVYMDAGGLVPDELLIDLVKDRLAREDVQAKGCLLDGFPRTPGQGKAMWDAGLFADAFVLIEVGDDILVERGVGRRLDPVTGEIYHLKFKPPPPEIVDRLVHRSDDQEDKIRSRLEAYHSQIDGILPYFKECVTRVNGNQSPDDVFAAACQALDVVGGRSTGQGPPKAPSRPQQRGGVLAVIAGPPASGKGTQCDKIKAQYGFVHVSTGDILRENVKKGTELGMKAKTFMDTGALVPDELLIDLVKDRLAQSDVQEHGCLLDGFPRTPGQAKAMVDANLKVDIFLLIKVPDADLVRRGCGRRLDPDTGDIYHLEFKPPPPEIVSRLVHRSDDQEDKIRARLDAYHSQINGILEYYTPVLHEVDGNQKPDDVFRLVAKELDSVR